MIRSFITISIFHCVIRSVVDRRRSCCCISISVVPGFLLHANVVLVPAFAVALFRIHVESPSDRRFMCGWLVVASEGMQMRRKLQTAATERFMINVTTRAHTHSHTRAAEKEKIDGAELVLRLWLRPGGERSTQKKNNRNDDVMTMDKTMSALEFSEPMTTITNGKLNLSASTMAFRL